MASYDLSKPQADWLDEIQRQAFGYFLERSDARTGLVADSTWTGAPSSIAATGFGLACFAVGAERRWLARDEAVERVLRTLRFFASAPQGPEPESTGYRGFYYHFLDMRSGLRTWRCELSTIDTAILLAGMLASAEYFDRDTAGEKEIRRIAQALYGRAEWRWAQNGSITVTHGWTPEGGFLPYRWQGYDEGLLIYLLGLGAPEHRLAPESYAAYTASYEWTTLYGYELLYAGPLFIHHFTQVWLDFRGLQDDFMRAHGIDYFENTRRAVYVHQCYAIDNPQDFVDYGEFSWGITASEGPAGDSLVLERDGRRYYGYLARGVPGPDDGTLSPWTAVTSLPFAPEIALPTIQHFHEAYPQLIGPHGLKCSLNPSFRAAAPGKSGWFSQNYYGLNEGPVVLMIENYRTGLVWKHMQSCRYLAEGLRRAGFR